MFSSNTSAVSADATYIEDVFSTWLYTGNGSAQGINNGIDLWNKGGMVWIKDRTTANSHAIFDTARGVYNYLSSDTTAAQVNSISTLSTFSSDGAGAPGFFVRSNALVGTNGDKYASWTFRKQPKFFDVVTWTGNGASGRQIPHSLGSVPGCIIVKTTSFSENWVVYHRSLPSSDYVMLLNTTSAQINVGSSIFGATPTSTEFTVGNAGQVNSNGATYVAYLFAHNAGGFGLTGTDNVISCGSVTDNNRVELGYEPQFLLLKTTSTTGNWILVDTMRGLTATTGIGNATLFPNTTGAEATGSRYANIDATGFTSNMGAPGTHIYIAIRRGPMKTPTTGTSVFVPVVSASAVGTATTTNFPVDLQIFTATGVTDNKSVVDRLRGVNTSTTLSSLPRLNTVNTDAEASSTLYSNNWGSTGFGIPGANASVSSVYWNFRRSPGFFDEVCYTGTGATINQSHNLGVPPELIFFKSRSAATGWRVIGNIGVSAYDRLVLQTTAAATSDGYGSAKELVSQPTSSVLSIGTGSTLINSSGATYVAYLFASCPGVSKVGSYTGTGTTLQINCGFTGGARFVLIKRTDSTGDWYVWDTARGIVAGNDPYLLLNSTAAEVTTTDYVDTYSAGFEISSTAPAAINASGGTFIYLAIA